MRTYYDDVDIDEDIDLLYPKENGHDKVFAVPRSRRCTSRVYIHIINEFGHLGGFDAIKQTIAKACLVGSNDD